ncbi:hypothetical protein RUM43_008420 [Polyplax serrata]|uniref:Small ribosomal subunit protein mS25 n=1 Tax=Polyplax serrata TaxID=468196 RepID=A0AAN8S1A3_POLSC
MPFMIGKAPIRRTLQYLERGKIVFRETVKVFSVNYNMNSEHHSGARDFIFWYLPQIQYKNPNVQCICLKNLTPSPYIRIFFENGKSTLIDIDSRKKEDILNHLINFTAVCKTRNEIVENLKNANRKSRAAYFGYDCERHCICEILGQVPCPALVGMPSSWRGMPEKIRKYTVPPCFMEAGLEKLVECEK